LGWAALTAASLVIGALLALARRWRNGVVGAVLAFGAGALISSVAFELAQEGLQIGSPTSVAIGLTLGPSRSLSPHRAVGKIGGRGGGGAAGLPLALGSLLDGIPEQAVLGIGLATGEGVSVALLVAICVSNLPDGVGSAAALTCALRASPRRGDPAQG
jgi:ZIP family zinc transporter